MTREGIIDAPRLNLSKPVKITKGDYLKIKSISPDKFHIWYDIDGCGETTLAITPLKSERQAKTIQKEIIRNADDIIYWQNELQQTFGEVSLGDVIYYAKKYKTLVGLIESHIKSNKNNMVPYDASCKSSVINELETIIEEIEK